MFATPVSERRRRTFNRDESSNTESESARCRRYAAEEATLSTSEFKLAGRINIYAAARFP